MEVAPALECALDLVEHVLRVECGGGFGGGHDHHALGTRGLERQRTFQRRRGDVAIPQGAQHTRGFGTRRWRRLARLQQLGQRSGRAVWLRRDEHVGGAACAAAAERQAVDHVPERRLGTRDHFQRIAEPVGFVLARLAVERAPWPRALPLLLVEAPRREEVEQVLADRLGEAVALVGQLRVDEVEVAVLQLLRGGAVAVDVDEVIGAVIDEDRRARLDQGGHGTAACARHGGDGGQLVGKSRRQGPRAEPAHGVAGQVHAVGVDREAVQRFLDDVAHQLLVARLPPAGHQRRGADHQEPALLGEIPVEVHGARTAAHDFVASEPTGAASVQSHDQRPRARGRVGAWDVPRGHRVVVLAGVPGNRQVFDEAPRLALAATSTLELLGLAQPSGARERLCQLVELGDVRRFDVGLQRVPRGAVQLELLRGQLLPRGGAAHALERILPRGIHGQHERPRHLGLGLQLVLLGEARDLGQGIRVGAVRGVEPLVEVHLGRAGDGGFLHVGGGHPQQVLRVRHARVGREVDVEDHLAGVLLDEGALGPLAALGHQHVRRRNGSAHDEEHERQEAQATTHGVAHCRSGPVVASAHRALGPPGLRPAAGADCAGPAAAP